MSDFTFSELSPDRILDALESVGIYPQSGLLALNSYENRVYQFVEDSGQRMVVKFYRPGRWTNEQIQEEHDYAHELLESELPMSAPLKLHGETLQKVEDMRFALFASVGGRAFEIDNLDHLEWMGRFIGRMHMVGAKQSFRHRPSIECESFLHRPAEILRTSTLLPDTLKTAFFAILTPLIELTESLYSKVDTPAIRLHGDCHPGNILWRDGPTFVDLDDCRNGPAIQDLWMMLNGDRQQQLLQLETLLDAYEEFSELPSQQLALIEPLRAMRMVHYMAWLAQRWHDPAFPRAFPWFAENKYWEGQILALKEQYAALQEPPLALLGGNQ